jgi:hypothetical protein
MKTSTYVLFAGLLGGLLLLNDSAFPQFPNDQMPHFGNSNCSAHLVDPTPLGAAPQTMRMCAQSSGATTWSATIVRMAIPPVTVCTRSSVPVTTTSFQCNITAPGSYKGTITYCIGSSCFNGHPDFKWTR